VDRHVEAGRNDDLRTHDQRRAVDGERHDATPGDRVAERGTVTRRDRCGRGGGGRADHVQTSGDERRTPHPETDPSDHPHPPPTQRAPATPPCSTHERTDTEDAPRGNECASRYLRARATAKPAFTSASPSEGRVTRSSTRPSGTAMTSPAGRGPPSRTPSVG